MEILKTQQLTAASQFEQINQLWNEEFPVNLNNRFGILLDGATNFNHYLVEATPHNVAAWAVDFEKDNEIRFSLIVAGKHQGKGIGTALLQRLKNDLGEFYGWVIDHNNDIKANGEPYRSPLLFYVKQGFEVLHLSRIDSDMLHAVKIKRGC
ncbi:MAG: GNAT family N-acetyltransferase [Bacteroidetes bacterium]|nr:GNAT family N-acetyltransferase [Bacteroidota bacterium]